MDWMTFLHPSSPHSRSDYLAFFALPRLHHPRLLPSWVGVSAPSRAGFRECSGEGRAVAASQVALSPNLAPSCANEAGLFAFHANEQIPEEVPFSPGGSLCSHSWLSPSASLELSVVSWERGLFITVCPQGLTPFSLWAVSCPPSWFALPRQDQGKRPHSNHPPLTKKMKPERLA